MDFQEHLFWPTRVVTADLGEAFADDVNNEVSDYVVGDDGFSLLDQTHLPATAQLVEAMGETARSWVRMAGYDSDAVEPHMTRSWTHLTGPGDMLTPHQHQMVALAVTFIAQATFRSHPLTGVGTHQYEAPLEGAFYIQRPHGVHIVDDSDRDTVQVPPVPGRLMCFPANLWHGQHPIMPGVQKQRRVMVANFGVTRFPVPGRDIHAH